MSAPPLSRLEESLLAIDTRLLMMVACIREIECRLTNIETVLHRTCWPETETSEADVEPVSPKRRRPTHAQVQRDNAVLDALEQGPLTLTEVARAIHRTDRITDSETSGLWPVLQRLIRNGYVVVDDRKQYSLRPRKEIAS